MTKLQPKLFKIRWKVVIYTRQARAFLTKKKGREKTIRKKRVFWLGVDGEMAVVVLFVTQRIVFQCASISIFELHIFSGTRNTENRVSSVLMSRTGNQPVFTIS